ncbi:uncharacterized protein KGF55_002758 [Candida pseudojiufengensis]|uniref:uncharacterized protein n=1 Tax=Candida pseudojiufengensis TaxID=497109 RepID=UPI0022258E28|nr:uncharacterized protein KGF55_002758 [Candida pseudojiufengensis]KAI5962966.1 hypothetical protein KGF55_002758 [Candida pseudojiufengensis]
MNPSKKENIQHKDSVDATSHINLESPTNQDLETSSATSKKHHLDNSSMVIDSYAGVIDSTHVPSSNERDSASSLQPNYKITRNESTANDEYNKFSSNTKDNIDQPISPGSKDLKQEDNLLKSADAGDSNAPKEFIPNFVKILGEDYFKKRAPGEPIKKHPIPPEFYYPIPIYNNKSIDIFIIINRYWIIKFPMQLGKKKNEMKK